MEFTLSPELERFVANLVETGQFADPDEVVAEALAALKTRQQCQAEELDELRREVAIGIEQADRGEFVEFSADEIKAEGRKRLSAERTG